MSPSTSISQHNPLVTARFGKTTRRNFLQKLGLAIPGLILLDSKDIFARPTQTSASREVDGAGSPENRFKVVVNDEENKTHFTAVNSFVDVDVLSQGKNPIGETGFINLVGVGGKKTDAILRVKQNTRCTVSLIGHTKTVIKAFKDNTPPTDDTDTAPVNMLIDVTNSAKGPLIFDRGFNTTALVYPFLGRDKNKDVTITLRGFKQEKPSKFETYNQYVNDKGGVVFIKQHLYKVQLESPLLSTAREFWESITNPSGS